MTGSKWFYFETRGFQNATNSLLCLVCLVAGLGIWSACSRSSPALRPDTVGLIVVETRGDTSGDLHLIAEALLGQMRHDRLRVGLYSRRQHAAQLPVERWPPTESTAGTLRLKQAWAAYYQMRFGEAARLADLETRQYPLATDDGLRARLLAALICLGSRNRSKARSILHDLPLVWPALALSNTQYPPRFITLYRQIVQSVQHSKRQLLVLDARRPLTALRIPIRAVAEAHHWKQVWLLRVMSQGGKKRAELQQVSDGGRRFTHYRAVRFGPAARPEKVAGMLWAGRAAI